jgi:hypothetical protein
MVSALDLSNLYSNHVFLDLKYVQRQRQRQKKKKKKKVDHEIGDDVVDIITISTLDHPTT